MNNDHDKSNNDNDNDNDNFDEGINDNQVCKLV